MDCNAGARPPTNFPAGSCWRNLLQRVCVLGKVQGELVLVHLLMIIDQLRTSQDASKNSTPPTATWRVWSACVCSPTSTFAESRSRRRPRCAVDAAPLRARAARCVQDLHVPSMGHEHELKLQLQHVRDSKCQVHARSGAGGSVTLCLFARNACRSLTSAPRCTSARGRIASSKSAFRVDRTRFVDVCGLLSTVRARPGACGRRGVVSALLAPPRSCPSTSPSTATIPPSTFACARVRARARAPSQGYFSQ